MARTQGQMAGANHTVFTRCPSDRAPAMTSKSRFFVLIAAASLPLMAACSESPTAPETFKTRRMSVSDSLGLVELGCGEYLPWGKAPCALNM